MEIRHNLILTPAAQDIDLVIVNTTQEESHGIDGAHRAGKDVLGEYSQRGAHVAGVNEEGGSDIGTEDTLPLVTVGYRSDVCINGGAKLAERECERSGDTAVRESTSRSIILNPLYFLVLENKVFLPSFSFFEFTRTMLSSHLSNICIYNTSTGYSRPFKLFYKVICSVACGQRLSYIRFYKLGISKAWGLQLGDQIVF